MKKNGFTLIEMTAIVLILSVLTVFVVPRVSSIISNNKNKVCKSIVTSIEEAAKNYTYLNSNRVENEIKKNSYFEVTLLDLKKEGLLDIQLENPYTNEEIADTNKVKISKSGNIYSYKYLGDECK